MSTSGRVFNIQKFSIHDGPGIRTIVFLKGCPLRCQWCSNPEGLERSSTLAVDTDKCLTADVCSRCVDVCPAGALHHGQSTRAITIDRSRCELCGTCMKACPTRAVELFGTEMTATEVMSIVEQDDIFYSTSRGGLTLSGGEPLFQPDFARTLLSMARSCGMDVAIETSGYAPLQDVVNVFEQCDFIYYDIKTMDREKHQSYTGVDNQRIIANLAAVCTLFPTVPLCVRTPVIPGFNDRKEDIEQISRFLLTLPRTVVHELLPYHQFGERKYSLIALVGNDHEKPVPTSEYRDTLAELKKQYER